MPHILKNENVEILIDLPLKNYSLPRFDWTGKIVSAKYKNRYVSGVELIDYEEGTQFGKGFYNEFGIDAPVGYSETRVGEWFHKIGVGLLKKEEGEYAFFKPYEIRPAAFSFSAEKSSVHVKCRSELCNGYSYVLNKKIELLESGFSVSYHLENTGEKVITTNEYNHNFLAIDGELIGKDYVLKFPFILQPDLFGEKVNSENMVVIEEKDFTFLGKPESQFFFSNLTGGKTVEASWKLENIKRGIGISETASFQTKAINLWGWGHVISPELFFQVDIEAGKSDKWSRVYHFYDLS